MPDSKVELRRYQDMLRTSGFAVIAFGAWTTVKTVAYLIQGRADTEAELASAGMSTEYMWIARLIIIVFLALLFGLIFGFHLWMGKGAISESRGHRLKRPYVAAAVLIIALTLALYVAEVILFFKAPGGMSDADSSFSISSFLVDITFIYALWVMIRSARKVRKLTAESSKEVAA